MSLEPLSSFCNLAKSSHLTCMGNIAKTSHVTRRSSPVAPHVRPEITQRSGRYVVTTAICSGVLLATLATIGPVIGGNRMSQPMAGWLRARERHSSFASQPTCPFNSRSASWQGRSLTTVRSFRGAIKCHVDPTMPLSLYATVLP